MDFEEFQAVAEAAFQAIPAHFREGIDGLVVRKEAETHPEMPDIFTLGYCQTESYPSDWVGPETTRSTVLLYYGSFRAVAEQEPDFDWEAEIHETARRGTRSTRSTISTATTWAGVCSRWRISSSSKSPGNPGRWISPGEVAATGSPHPLPRGTSTTSGSRVWTRVPGDWNWSWSGSGAR